MSVCLEAVVKFKKKGVRGASGSRKRVWRSRWQPRHLRVGIVENSREQMDSIAASAPRP